MAKTRGEDDAHDPMERMNILSALVMPVGAFDDPLHFLERLRRTPLCKSVRLGALSFADLAATPASAQTLAAFQDTDAALLAANHQALVESLASVQALSDVIDERVGSAKSIDWAPLLTTLAEIEKALRPFVPGAVAPAGGEIAGAVAGGEAPPAGGGVSGAIQSRADVVQALERICEFYRQAEPSSPVPLLLRRAQRLAEMDFLQIIENLSPETVAHVRSLMGEAPPAESAGSGA